MATSNRNNEPEKARIRINIEATGEEGEEFRIQIYSGHSQTTKGDRGLLLVVYKVMTALMKRPARTKTVTMPDGTEKKVAPKTKSGKPFPTMFPFAIRKK